MYTKCDPLYFFRLSLISLMHILMNITITITSLSYTSSYTYNINVYEYAMQSLIMNNAQKKSKSFDLHTIKETSILFPYIFQVHALINFMDPCLLRDCSDSI